MRINDRSVGVSRRSFVQTLGVSAAAGAIAERAHAAARMIERDRAQDNAANEVTGPGATEISLQVNGQQMKVSVDPATTLLDALRMQLNLTGSKEICDRGACGGCSVLVDGKLITSCMMLALDAVGTEITTIEGLSKNGELDPVQEAFIRHDALQCGYCTPGLVLASRALLNEKQRPTLEEIKHGLSGNICRCGTYTNIFNAVLEASGQPVPIDGANGGAA
jgi:aerobic-type carbon monoxide dehydrogenase small subunit (CoxS/CutS family)